MKKILALLLALIMVFGLVACGETAAPAENNETAAGANPVKVGFIFLHDEQSTYDLNFIKAAKEACTELGVEYVQKVGIPEGQECYEAAMDLVDEGCNIVFADSFGHEDYMIQAAKECPNVEFCHATGTKAHTEGLANYHNAFASIYEGRYLAGIAAGMKLNELIEQGKLTDKNYNPDGTVKVGYVGAYTYAEVISGYTSYFLGLRSVVPNAAMEVTFTGSWYDMALETEGAQKLIDNGCAVISQHADSLGAPSACEAAGVPNISYNGSTIEAGPNTFIVSSRINWAPYFKYIIGQVQAGQPIDTDWTGTIATGSVELSEINTAAAAAGTAEAIEAAKAELAAGTLHVFDTEKFTVEGAKLESYMADVDTDEAYTKDTEVIADGYFHESEFRSAPYFDLQIDGITLLDTNFG
ncbi:MAG: BMP family ABC transporter substrate-binding protein [Oscillospiraceae bacterium]|nr:BMP family ABC transporter substrate-binding protein [Oscillospiraceae bacterium]MBR3849907.1 BMP family ABC transporter substrate-binding protein [Oscillospiraceae bacterium]